MIWFEAARPKTLAAGVAPVLVGTAATGRFDFVRFALCLAIAAGLQIAANFANDYFDADSGVDTEERVGPRRATASGLVTRGQMRVATIIAFLFSAAAGGALASIVGLELLAVGAAALLAAFFYSGGPRPYASLGLGEVFVFVFFGLIATGGAAYAQTAELNSIALLGGVSLGFLASALLAVNNLRDFETDTLADKRTLAVRFGPVGTRELYRLLVLASFVPVFVIAIVNLEWWPLLALFAVPFAIASLRSITVIKEGRELNHVLASTARLEFVFGVLLAAGLWAS